MKTFLCADSKQPEDDAEFSSPLMRLLQQEHRQQDSMQETKPRTGLLFEISSDDGFQISSNSIEGKCINRYKNQIEPS